MALQSHFVPFFIIYRKKGARGMLKERIRTDCGNGDNCSQVILRAVAEEYGISLSEELFCACRGIHGGFGINGMCSGIVAGVMALGLLCEEEELKPNRFCFFFGYRIDSAVWIAARFRLWARIAAAFWRKSGEFYRR